LIKFIRYVLVDGWQVRANNTGPYNARDLPVEVWLRNAARAVLNPELEESGETGYRKQTESRAGPSKISASTGIRHNAPNYGHARAHGGDNVADPVHKVEECAFGLRTGLTLNRHIRLRSGAKVLSKSHGLANH
jgi:hypothetical protein